MKQKRKILLPFTVAVMALAIVLISCTTGDGVMSKKKGVYTVNTTTLSKEVKGYNGPTPLLVSIKDNKIVKVEALENEETPKFFKHMTDSGMLERWNGMTVDEVLTAKVDVVAGATFSSNAVIKNVVLAVKYYKEHKK